MIFEQKSNYAASDLIEIVRLLRLPDGCPWDRVQTHETIRTNLIEETYEVADAIDQKNPELLCEELGDLFLQIALHTQMQTEKGNFNFEDVCTGICKKLIHRHPHIFENVQSISAKQVLKNWEEIKNAEKGRKTAADRLDSVPKSLPALMRSEKTQKRAAEFGFSYETAKQALDDLEAEIAELKQAMETGEGLSHEAGDVLFSAANVARMLKIDAEQALSECCTRFANRVKTAEKFANEKLLSSLSKNERHVLWQKAKEEGILLNKTPI